MSVIRYLFHNVNIGRQPRVRGQPTLLFHSRWRPTQELTEFSVDCGQRHYEARPYERKWMTTFEQNGIFPGPTRKREKNWKLVGSLDEPIAAWWLGERRDINKWALETLEKRASKPSKKISAVSRLLPVNCLPI
jgi:hypothetical protein